MAPRGGYKRNTDPRGEYVRLDQVQDAEAKLCAARMGQTLEVWIADAVQHHLYRCELIQAKERYQADEMEARRQNLPTPDPNHRDYQTVRPQPTITRQTEQGSGYARQPRPY